MRAALAILMMVAATLLSACTTTRAPQPDPALVARIEFPKPKGWVVTTLQELLSGPYSEPIYTDYGVKATKRPDSGRLYLYSKYREPVNFLNPNISVRISDAKIANYMGAGMYLDGVLYDFMKMLNDVEPGAPARKTTISGYPAAEVTMRYVLHLSDGRHQRGVARLWAVPVDGWFVTISAEWPADEKLISEAEMMRIVNTIRIRPAAP